VRLSGHCPMSRNASRPDVTVSFVQDDKQGIGWLTRISAQWLPRYHPSQFRVDLVGAQLHFWPGIWDPVLTRHVSSDVELKAINNKTM
jgi:hypothetical protein